MSAVPAKGNPAVRGDRRRGVVRATSGAGAFGSGSARARGACRASLGASEVGAPIYRRLGFKSVAKLTRFFYSG